MNLRGAGWLVGSAVTILALGSVAACDDGDPASTTQTDGGITLPDSGGASTPPADGGSSGQDSGSDAGQDANVPAQCNDGKVDLGETCDPLDKCPTECAPVGCNLRALENGGTCAAVCTTVAVQTQCQNGDGCCPTDCSIANDNDCGAVCGNGVKEAGEKCDGADCPTVCPPIGCMVRKLINGGTCTAECVDATTPITTCGAVADGGGASDNCCPGTCNAANDPDCAAGACGNNTVDPGEKCDTGIAGSCPTTCPAQACNLFKLSGAGTCQAECTANGTIDQCINNDGCCAPGCNNTNDSDCAPVCGNGVIESPTETCDTNCPTSCPAQGCQLYSLQNGGTCTAKCVAAGTQAACANGDGCCPSGCTSANDNDCAAEPPKCGNGVLDPNETCDNSSPTPCPVCNTNVTCMGTTGSAATCDLRCDQPIGKCSSKLVDACCPFAAKDGSDCSASSDADCNGDSWKSVSIKEPVLIKDGDCVVVTIENIEAGGAYDVTTCSPDPVAIGDVYIKSVLGVANISIGLPPRPIQYGSNEDCLEKYALPLRAGFTCDNKDGKPTMACVAEGTGGFIAKNAYDLQVAICAQKGEATVPFTIFYNSKLEPKITSIK